MRRVALIVVGFLALAAPAAASEEHPTLAELERELVCPTCKTTLQMSNAPAADRMRAFIRQRIAAGDTKSEIKDKLVAQFGEAILAAPPRRGWDLLVWWLPVAGVLVGALTLGIGAWRWSRTRGTAERLVAENLAPLDSELERRLDEELARM